MKISKTITSGIAATAFIAAVSLAYAQSSDTPAAAPATTDSMQTMPQQQNPATQPAATAPSDTPAMAPSDSTSTTPGTATSPAASNSTNTDMNAVPERAPQADRN